MKSCTARRCYFVAQFSSCAEGGTGCAEGGTESVKPGIPQPFWLKLDLCSSEPVLNKSALLYYPRHAAMDIAEVLNSMDLNGPTVTGISAVADVGLAASDKLPIGVERGDTAPANAVHTGVVAAVLKHFTPNLNTAQVIAEQPKHVALCVATACTMTLCGLPTESRLSVFFRLPTQTLRTSWRTCRPSGTQSQTWG
eukprot:5764110-Amphidinium_carterae.1